VTLEILDAQGKLVRRLSSVEKKDGTFSAEWPDLELPEDRVPAEAGMNRFSWDLRIEGPRKLSGELMGDLVSRGPLALPGKYQARLTAEGKSQVVPLEVKLDPRVNAQTSDLETQQELNLKIRDRITELHDTLSQIRDTRSQLHGLRQRMGENARLKAIVEASDSLDKKMTPIEEELLQVKSKSTEANLNYPVMLDERLHSLAFSVDGADAAPTKQQYEVFETLSQQSGVQVAKWKDIMAGDVVALNELIRKESIPVIYIAPPSAQSQSLKAGGPGQE
jgi:hypothetical protein